MKKVMFLAVTVACLGVRVASATDNMSVACNSPLRKTVNLLDGKLLAKPFVFVGEIHGNNETPAFTAALVCRLARNGQRVLLAVEASDNVQIPNRNDAGEPFFNKDDGGISESYWLPEKHYGRTSHAMLKLFNDIKPVASITFVDVPWPWSQPVGNRDAWMAENLRKQWQTGKFDQIVFFGGNYHTRLAGRLNTSAPAVADYLDPNDVVSIAVFSAGGTSWACRGDEGCGPHSFGRGEQISTATIEVLAARSNLPYSIVVKLPLFTPSFPLGQ